MLLHGCYSSAHLQVLQRSGCSGSSLGRRNALFTRRQPARRHSAARCGPQACSANEHAAMQHIRSAVADADKQAVSCCTGSVQLDRPVGVFGTDRQGNPFGLQLPIKNEHKIRSAMRKLLDVCIPAGLQKPAVEQNWSTDRILKRWQLPAERFATTFNISEHGILTDIQVEPVTKGHRVTLVYDLVTAEDGDVAANEDTAIHDASTSLKQAAELPFLTALSTALQDPSFMPKGGMLGIACNHRYAISTGTKLTWQLLKGIDTAVYAAARRVGIVPNLRFVFRLGYGGSWCNSIQIMRDNDDSSSDAEYDPILALNYDLDSEADIVWLNKDTLRYDNEHEYRKWNGNEVCTCAEYSAAAMFLYIPPFYQRPIRLYKGR